MPRLDDPEEFATVRDMYFEGYPLDAPKTDPIENLERMESRFRNNQKSSR